MPTLIQTGTGDFIVHLIMFHTALSLDIVKQVTITKTSMRSISEQVHIWYIENINRENWKRVRSVDHVYYPVAYKILRKYTRGYHYRER